MGVCRTLVTGFVTHGWVSTSASCICYYVSGTRKIFDLVVVLLQNVQMARLSARQFTLFEDMLECRMVSVDDGLQATVYVAYPVFKRLLDC